MSWFRLKGCPKCRGDLASDDGDWLCLQCGTYYYTGLYRTRARKSGPEAGKSRNGRWTSQTIRYDRNTPEYPPQSPEKALSDAPRVVPVSAYGTRQVAAVTAGIIPSSHLTMLYR